MVRECLRATAPYAVSVFLSFLAGLLAMARFSRHDRHIGALVLNITGAVAVGFTLIIDLARGAPLVSLAAALLIAAALQWMWIKAGRPHGIRNAAAQADSDDAPIDLELLPLDAAADSAPGNEADDQRPLPDSPGLSLRPVD